MLKLHFILLKKDLDYLDLFQINTMHSASAKFPYYKCHLGFFCIEIHFCVNRGVFYCAGESGWVLRCAGAAGRDGMGCAVGGMCCGYHGRVGGTAALLFAVLALSLTNSWAHQQRLVLSKSHRPPSNQQGFSGKSRDLLEPKISLSFPNKTRSVFKLWSAVSLKHHLKSWVVLSKADHRIKRGIIY